MDLTSKIRAELGDEWLPAIYENKIRPQRTRAYILDVPQKENPAEILHTLLGIELKVGKRRFACPDLATARYLRIFARIGCRDVAIPYDITRISAIADELETSWQKALLLVRQLAAGESTRSQSRRRGQLLKEMRAEIEAIGSGDAVPEFRQSTSRSRL